MEDITPNIFMGFYIDNGFGQDIRENTIVFKQVQGNENEIGKRFERCYDRIMIFQKIGLLKF